MRDNINPKPETLGDILALALKRLPEKDIVEIWNDRSVKLYRVARQMPTWFLIEGLSRREMISASDTVYRHHRGAIVEIVRAP